MARSIHACPPSVHFAAEFHEPPGPMTLSKEGTVHEIQFAEQQWMENRCFALLHDITDCLRIGDVTAFRDRGDDEQDILLYELKTNPRRRESTQLTRTRLAAEALHTGGPLPGPDKAVLVETGVPYATHMSVLSDALGRAHQEGLKTMRVPGQRGLLALDIAAAGNRWDAEEAARQFHAAYAALLRRMRLTGQRICFSSGDSGAQHHGRAVGYLSAPVGAVCRHHRGSSRLHRDTVVRRLC
ncbi:hypothetical protein [Streptomyces sp. NBC_00872]|uniref:hypothetical protein n=1 Tax=Streptomyces sp. NBC_00872 TaxID=2903686 RepID=UPI003867DB40|nr:hypothetical protein OG214_01870 [Streptomyces sp. NBC_00872]